MREIKFRAWNNRLNKYIDMFLGFTINDGVLEYLEDVLHAKKQVIIEQYTGLKDKNGVEIYEGDIVNGIQDVVIYIDGRFEPICWYKPESFEVIGNIHENADLLVNETDRISPDDIGNDIHEFLHGGDKQ